MVSLKLFGGLSVAREQGPVSGPAAQRHRLALLALLALAPRSEQSRDKLVGYLWPESDADHARNLLSQAVHALRKALGDDLILSRGDELRLNADAVDCDVIEFEQALAADDPAHAVAAYAGPLLDGFFLREAPEFERWLDRERARLASACAGALEALATAAEDQHDFMKAAEWWKERALLDPCDSRVAISLMNALASSGNRAGALQHAAIHQRLLQEDFGARPAPEVLALAERLRNEPASPTILTVAARNSGSPDAPAKAPGGTAAPGAPPSADGLAPSPPIAAPRGFTKRLQVTRYAVVALALGAVFFGAIQLAPRAATPAPAKTRSSIAVLPLATTDQSDVALANGMTEELIAMLAKAGLRVIASTTVAGFRDRQIDVRSIAESLQVDHILEGGLQKSGSRLRIRLRLVDGRDGATRWSESYDRELRDIFAVQEDVAASVARQLGVRLGLDSLTPLRRLPTHSVAAYELYLRGSDPALLRSDSGARARLEYFRRAVALDPTYAAAYAGLAKSYLRVSMTDAVDTASGKLQSLAQAAALKALALDDSLAEAHHSYGVARLFARDHATAETRFKRAIALDPASARLREALASLYIVTGRPAEALAQAERALELDPLSPSASADLARALLANGRCGEALQRLEKIAAVRPPLLRAVSVAAQCHALEQRWPEAIATLRPHAEHDLPMRALHGHMLARAGEREEALRVQAALLERWRRRNRGAAYVGIVYAGLGDTDQAFAWLNRGVDDGSLGLVPPNAMVLEPVFEELHRDPRFKLLKRRLGLQSS